MNIFGKLISDLRGDNIVVNRDDFFKYLLFELTKHEGLDFCLIREDDIKTSKLPDGNAIDKKYFSTLSICLDNRKVISHTILTSDVIIDGVHVTPVDGKCTSNNVSFSSLRKLVEPLYKIYPYLSSVVDKIKNELIDAANSELYGRLMLDRKVVFNYLAIILSRVEKSKYDCVVSLEKNESLPVSNTYEGWYSFVYRTFKIKHGSETIVSCSDRHEYHADGENYDFAINYENEDEYISFEKLKEVFINIYPQYPYLEDVFNDLKSELLRVGSPYIENGELLCERLDYNADELKKIFDKIDKKLRGTAYQKK